MKQIRLLGLIILMNCSLTHSGSVYAISYTFDYSGQVIGGDINNVGEFVGGGANGAFLDSGGVITFLSYPAATSTNQALGINDDTEIVGISDAGSWFLKNGAYTGINWVGATTCGGMGRQ